MKLTKWSRELVLGLVISTGLAGVQSASAATMIATQEAMSADLGTVENFLDREDVTRALENLGTASCCRIVARRITQRSAAH